MAKNILFVDDDKDWHLIIESCLKENGYEVITAKDASEAMAQLDQNRFDLLILDLNLAGENAASLMEVMKVNQPALPIIVYSSLPLEDESLRNLIKQHSHRYLQKGSLEELLQAIRTMAAKQ